MNAVQQSAKLAHKGDYAAARMFNLSNKKVLSRAAKTETQQRQYKLWASDGRRFESEMNEVQRDEDDDMIDNEAADDDDEEEDEEATNSNNNADGKRERVEQEKKAKVQEKMKKKEDAVKVTHIKPLTLTLTH